MFQLVHEERANYPVSFSCRVLGVSRSGYYRWAKAKPAPRTRENQKLLAEIRDIHRAHKGRYGSPRIHRELQGRGHKVGRNRVARIMRQEGLRGRTPRRFRKTTDSRHHHRIAPNLLARDFTADEPNRIWVGDITYIPTLDGWLYLAVLLDLFSRRVVGWTMSDRIDTELALGALQIAWERRKPAPGLIHHTDRDCRYASDDYQAALRDREIAPSMSRKGDCWDNAVAESFFATLEKELFGEKRLLSRADTRLKIANYIESYYNDVRRHSYINYVSPLEFELTMY